MAVTAIHFGNYVRQMRIEKGLNLRQLAERSGISQPTLIKYESSAVLPALYESSFGKLAKGLGVTPAVLDLWKTTPVEAPRRKSHLAKPMPTTPAPASPKLPKDHEAVEVLIPMEVYRRLVIRHETKARIAKWLGAQALAESKR